MILFVGALENGYFLLDVGKTVNQGVDFTGALAYTSEIEGYALKKKYSHIVIYLDQFLSQYDDMANDTEKIKVATGADIIIFAPGYQLTSKAIAALYSSGLRKFVLSNSLSLQKSAVLDFLTGKEEKDIAFEIPAHDLPHNEEGPVITEKARKRLTIAVCGARSRMGTTTQALQIIKYFQVHHKKAIYVELNDNHFVKRLQETYDDSLFTAANGKVYYREVPMLYEKQRLIEALQEGYDIAVFDYGVFNNKIAEQLSFIETDIKLFVCGTAPSEFFETNTVLQKTLNYPNTFYLFSFCGAEDQEELKELMADKWEQTIFADYTPDPFAYTESSNLIYDRVFSDLVQAPEQKRKRPFFKWGGKK